MDLREELRRALAGHVAVVGVGNPDLGDDGAGVCVAEALAEQGMPDVYIGERSPERWLGRLAGGAYHSVLFVDVVEAGRPAGDVVLLDAAQVRARFPQVSTHRLTIGTLARLLETAGVRILLLGIQPGSLALGAGLSAPVQTTVAALVDLFTDLDIGPRAPAPLPVARGEQP